MRSGKYIARMDGDDECTSDRLEKQAAFLDDHLEFALVGTAMQPFDENGLKPIRYAKEIPEPMDMIKRSPFFHATIMMRQEAYDIVNGYTVSKRTTRGQDYDMWFRFFKMGLKGYNMQEPLYLVLEDKAAMKRRTFKTRFYEVQTKLIGYHMIKVPLHLYIYAFKPLLAAMIPAGVMQKYHVISDAKSGK